MRHLFLVNPAAGKRDQTPRILAMAERLRADHGLDCACLLTQRPGHAEAMARESASSGAPVRLYACGGDGTLHEVVNGAAGFPNAAVTSIPAGTGNDFLKNFGPEALPLFRDAEHLWDGPQLPLDLIDCNGRLCVTIACAGIDARVAEDVHRFAALPFLSGRGSYLLSVASNFLFKGIGRRWTVTLDGEVQEGDFALAAVCNGRYYGGGSTPAPQARMTDGVLHTVLVKAVSRATFARLFGAYSAGRGADFPAIVRVVTAREIRIRARDGDLTAYLDGECFRAPEVTFRLSEKKVNLFAPPSADPDATAK